MTIDKKVAKVVKSYNRGKELQKNIERYKRLLEKGYIKKQTFSIIRNDNIGYSMSHRAQG
jgi:multidrug resistance efflux pump